MAEEPRKKVFDGKSYINLTQGYELLPSSQRCPGGRGKWMHRLSTLKIPASACIYTSSDDDSIRVDQTSGQSKTVWIPETVWKAVVKRVPINADQSWTKDLFGPNGYVNREMFAGLVDSRYDNLVPKAGPADRFATELSKLLPSEPMQMLSNGITYIHPAIADYIAIRYDAVFAARFAVRTKRAREECYGLAAEHDMALHRVSSDGRGTGNKEADVMRRLMESTGGEHSIQVPGATRSYQADIVTATHVIEIKAAKSITIAAHALGQCSWYCRQFHGKLPRVHLFGSSHEIEKCQDDAHLNSLAVQMSVEITFEVV
jgi:hypothetical protein